jgi:transcriptional regulator with XRE-family HTH domain
MLKDRIKQKRNEKKFTQEHLADLIGSKKSYVWELENKEKSNPSFKILNALAFALSTTVEYLTEGEADDKDQVFFRDYKKLNDETKSQLKDIMTVLKKGS